MLCKKVYVYIIIIFIIDIIYIYYDIYPDIATKFYNNVVQKVYNGKITLFINIYIITLLSKLSKKSIFIYLSRCTFALSLVYYETTT